MSIEAIRRPLPGPTEIARSLSIENLVNAAVAFAFSASGPVAIVLAVGARGGLDQEQIASWLFGSFFLNGLLSLAFCILYRQPLVFFWTIPGTVLVGPALGHLSFPEVVGAFLVSGLLMLALGLSGVVRRVMSAVPLAIVMGMVSGVFLPFGLEWLKAFQADFVIAAAMTGTFALLSASPRLSRRLPPLIAALVVGILVVVAAGALKPVLGEGLPIFAAPRVVAPAFSANAMLELVVPLAITVLIVQNGQGIAILTASGHNPPTNAIAAACGLWSMIVGLVGTVSTCLTGPTNAILASGSNRETHYTAGIAVGLMAIAFGVMAPLYTRLMLATPPAFIATLAGLAMLRVLQTAFMSAFQGRFGIGALVAFLVTVSGISIANIGAPFWGLVFGYLASRLLDAGDFVAKDPA